jgi:large subunit ribosomal protein L23
MHLYDVLRRPLITEKSTALQELNKYAFEVEGKATKPQIKQAVEKAFNVKVTKVNVITQPGKTRRMGKRIIVTPSRRKAIVTVKTGDKIGFFEGV